MNFSAIYPKLGLISVPNFETNSPQNLACVCAFFQLWYILSFLLNFIWCFFFNFTIWSVSFPFNIDNGSPGNVSLILHPFNNMENQKKTLDYKKLSSETEVRDIPLYILCIFLILFKRGGGSNPCKKRIYLNLTVNF